VLGAVIALAALGIRLRMPETRVFESARRPARRFNPLADVVRLERSAVLRVVALSGYMAIAYYVVAAWLPTFLDSFVGADAAQALLATSIALLFHVVGCPGAGALSDRAGRRPVLLSGAIALAVLALPLFWLVASTEFGRMLVGMLVLMVPVVLVTGPLMAATAELFPTSSRYSGAALGYSIGVSVFGGTAPLIATALVDATGWNLAASVYLIVPSVLVLPVIARMPETFRLRLDAA
jgi:MHS family proline/betaine transporter-like MFS transporter